MASNQLCAAPMMRRDVDIAVKEVMPPKLPGARPLLPPCAPKLLHRTRAYCTVATLCGMPLGSSARPGVRT